MKQLASKTCKMEATCSSKASVDSGLHGVICHKTVLFITTAVRTSDPTVLFITTVVRTSDPAELFITTAVRTSDPTNHFITTAVRT
jgi:hypothetical protein